MKSLKGTKTAKNVLLSFAGESQARNRYTYFASAAKKEGLEQVAAVFLETADQEKEHAKRFFQFLEGRVFKREKAVRWRCRNCGYIHEGKEAPQACPACAHPQAFFELLVENY
jgi:rubrerythrin